MSLFRTTHSSPVLRLALPLILSNITIPLLGVVDTMVMGHLPQAYYLGAVGVGSAIFNMLYWAFGFLRMGTTGIVAQSFGRDDKTAIVTGLLQALYAALIIAFLLLLLQGPIANVIFKLFDASPDVSKYASIYFHIRIWAAPATLANYVILGWFIGIQRTRASLVIMLITNIVGIGCDLLFVYGFGMAVAGVAWATVIAQYFALALGVYYIKLYSSQQGIPWHKQYFTLFSGIGELFRVNRNIFIRTLCLIVAFTFYTRQSAQYGAIILAANMVLLNFQTIMAYALDGFANAAEALVGKAIGQGDYNAFMMAARTTALWSFAVAIIFSLFYFAFGDVVISMLTSIPSVVAASNDYLIWSMISPIISVASYYFDGVFIGATRSREMRDAMLLSLLCFFITFYCLQSFANNGLWAALLVFMFARGVFMALYFPQIGKSLGPAG